MIGLELLVAGLVLGLANAAHCAGMCGAFALAAAPRPWTYLLGKTTTYVMLGTAAGTLGAVLLHDARELQQPLSWVTGGALVLVGVQRLAGFTVPGTRRVGRALERALAPWLRGVGAADAPGGRFLLGVVTGALPCGIVYVAALQGCALGRPLAAAAFMAAFGLGTAPVLLAVAWGGGAVRARLGPAPLRAAGGVLLVLAGALALVRADAPLVCHAPTAPAALSSNSSAD